MAEFTHDDFLGGALSVRQPAKGFRAGIDTVLLAAAVPAALGERALEAGAGAGIASLCLARRVPGLCVVGLEQDPALAALANENAGANGLSGRVQVEAGTLSVPPPAVARGGFAHAFANPPFFDEGETVAAAEPGRKAARQGPEGVLGLFVDFCLGHVVPGGGITLVHRADRLDRLLLALEGKAGAVTVFPLWPRQGEPAKRVIVAARKGARAPLRLSAGLILHGEGQGFTPAAEAVLRHGAPLALA